MLVDRYKCVFAPPFTSLQLRVRTATKYTHIHRLAVACESVDHENAVRVRQTPQAEESHDVRVPDKVPQRHG